MYLPISCPFFHFMSPLGRVRCLSTWVGVGFRARVRAHLAQVGHVEPAGDVLSRLGARVRVRVRVGVRVRVTVQVRVGSP